MLRTKNFNEWWDKIQRHRRIRCTMCNAEDPSVCTQCRSSTYCSSTCQREDWPLHRAFCKNFKPFQLLRPNNTYQIGVLFPVDEFSPRLVWVKCEMSRGKGEGSSQEISTQSHLVPQPRPYLGPDNPEEDNVCTEYNVARNFDLTHKIVLTRRADHMIGQPPNQSIKQATNRQVGDFWKGPVVLIHRLCFGGDKTGAKQKQLRTTMFRLGESTVVVDMTLADFRHGVDLLLTFPNIQMNETLREELDLRYTTLQQDYTVHEKETGAG